MAVPKSMLTTYLDRYIRLSVANEYRMIDRIPDLGNSIDYSCVDGACQTWDYYDGVDRFRLSDFITRICTHPVLTSLSTRNFRSIIPFSICTIFSDETQSAQLLTSWPFSNQSPHKIFNTTLANLEA